MIQMHQMTILSEETPYNLRMDVNKFLTKLHSTGYELFSINYQVDNGKHLAMITYTIKD